MIEKIKSVWKTTSGKILLSIAALVVFCFGCLMITSIISPKPATLPQADVQGTAEAMAWLSVTQTQAALTSSTPEPIAMPLPVTDTPVPPTAQPQATLGKVGDTVTQGGYSITLANVETATQYGYAQANAGNKFVAIEIVIVSGAASGVSANPLYASLKDSQGYAYNTTLMGKDPMLQSQNDMPIGEIMRGWITFEVPQTATGLVFSYEPLSFTGTVRIRFSIEQ